MVICIADLLSADELDRVRSLLRGAKFHDGRATAGWHARQAKRNEQAPAAPSVAEAAASISAALLRNETFRSAALPKALRPILFARYRPGMSYGRHVDDALMGEPALRTDLAVTVFLTAPGDYEGGELVIDSAAGEDALKLEAGAAVVYPATALHEVAPVSRGERLVAVTWAQSLVRRADLRELLFDLDAARRAVFAEAGKSRTFDLLAKTYANLLREWAEP